MAQLIGVVLAGGEGLRMGARKAELHLGEENLATRAAGVLWPLCASVLISIRSGDRNPAPKYEPVEDLISPPAGPLGGIHAAFEHSVDADLLVLACDYPRVSPDFLGMLVGRAEPGDDLVMPTDGRGCDHPLVGLWRRRCQPHVATAIEDRYYKVQALMADLEVRRIDPREAEPFDVNRMLLNLNRPEDLQLMD